MPRSFHPLRMTWSPSLFIILSSGKIQNKGMMTHSRGPTNEAGMLLRFRRIRIAGPRPSPELGGDEIENSKACADRSERIENQDAIACAKTRNEATTLLKTKDVVLERSHRRRRIDGLLSDLRVLRGEASSSQASFEFPVSKTEFRFSIFEFRS